MGFLDFLKAPRTTHPRFGELKYSGGFWRCEADYLGSEQVCLLLRGTREGIDPSVLGMCEELEMRFTGLKDEVGTALYEESYIPIREAIESGEYPEDIAEDIPAIEHTADVWKHVHPVWIQFGAAGEPDRIEIAVATDWEIEHTLGIGIKNWQCDYLNGSIIPA